MNAHPAASLTKRAGSRSASARLRLHDITLVLPRLLAADVERCVAEAGGSHGDERGVCDHVIVIAPTPAEARVGLCFAAQERVAGVLTPQDLRSLVSVVDAVRAGLLVVTREARASAVRVPRMTSRQEEILSVLLTRHSNPEISNQLFLSEATTKREVGMLCRLFGVRSRRELIRAAERLGLHREGPALCELLAEITRVGAPSASFQS